MKITSPDNCVELLKQCANNRSPLRGGTFAEEFYNTLAVVPGYAHEPEIRAMLLDALETQPLAYRIKAAKILHRIGDPLGILHLTYNSLSVHPLLKVRQDLASLWPEAHLLREADKLTEECLALLLADLEAPHAFWHMDTLAALPADLIVPHMREMLGQPGTRAMVAAYVLALKGCDDGRALLMELAESQKFLNLALIALSHIPDMRALSHFRLYADPNHPIYNRQYQNLYTSHAQSSGLMLHAQCRLYLLELKHSQPVRRTLEAFYLCSIQDLVSESDLRSFQGSAVKGAAHGAGVHSFEEWAEAAWRWIKPPRSVNYRLFVINSGIGLTSGALIAGANMPDFLCEFASAEDRAHCAEIQRVSIQALLKVIGWRTLGDGSDMGIRTTFFGSQALPPTGTELGYRNAPLYFPGFEIEYSPTDYEHAAVDWILNPHRYRTLSYWPKMLM